MNVFEAIEKVNKLKSKIVTLNKVIGNMYGDSYSSKDIENLKEDEKHYTKELKELEERMKATRIEPFTTSKGGSVTGRPTDR